jgi:hypothetical protein
MKQLTPGSGRRSEVGLDSNQLSASDGHLRQPWGFRQSGMVWRLAEARWLKRLHGLPLVLVVRQVKSHVDIVMQNANDLNGHSVIFPEQKNMPCGLTASGHVEGSEAAHDLVPRF